MNIVKTIAGAAAAIAATSKNEIIAKLALHASCAIYCRPKPTPLFRKRFEEFGACSQETAMATFKGLKIANLDCGPVKAEIISAHNCTEDSPIVIYFHGGGYGFGSRSSYRRFASVLSYRLRSKILLFDYRLAPENPFPAALDDAMEAFTKCLSLFPENKIFFGGDSAGGGLAMATMLYAKEQNTALPDGGFLLSPWLDLTGKSVSTKKNSWRDAMLKTNYIKAFAQNYIGSHDAQNPLISPLFGDLKEFPPLLILVSSSESLFDDSKSFTKAAKAANVEVDLKVYGGVQHVWPITTPAILKSKLAYQDISNFLKKTIP